MSPFCDSLNLPLFWCSVCSRCSVSVLTPPRRIAACELFIERVFDVKISPSHLSLGRKRDTSKLSIAHTWEINSAHEINMLILFHTESHWQAGVFRRTHLILNPITQRGKKWNGGKGWTVCLAVIRCFKLWQLTQEVQWSNEQCDPECATFKPVQTGSKEQGVFLPHHRPA